MAAVLGSEPSPPLPARDARLYQQATAHMHAGAWPDAIATLEELQRRAPDDVHIVSMLEQARLRAGYATAGSIRARRGGRSLRRIIVAALLLGGTAFFIWQSYITIRRGITPLLNEQQTAADLAQLLLDGESFMTAGNWDEAAAVYSEITVLEPDNAAARHALAQIEAERTLLQEYQEAVAAQQAGDCAGALGRFSTLMLTRTSYRDVDARVKQCRRALDAADLLTTAEQYYQLGLFSAARDAFEQVRSVDMTYEQAHVEARLFDVYMRLGRAQLVGGQLTTTQARAAVPFFAGALQLRPRDDRAIDENMLANAFIEGQEAVARSDWARAVTVLRIAYERRPDYGNGALPPPLYEAYLGLGDRATTDGDCPLAYEYFRRAAELPVDTTTARARVETAAACVTPTATPTQTALPTATPVPPSTAVPTPTPRPLYGEHDRILFKSENPEQPGFWLMNPDGSGRTFVGELYDESMTEQVAAIIASHRLSPDGRSRLYVDNIDGRPQIVMDVPPHPAYGELPDRVVTRLTGMAYDPVWSPDGALIAFVAQENESDDIWVTRPDSSMQKSLVRNPWEWDKHPTWSPDSTEIAFFSNRTGTSNIFIMDRNGQAVRNISNTPWNEYDPIWLR